MFSSGSMRLLDFLIYSVITVNTVFSWWIFFFLFFVLRYFVSGVCFIRLLYLCPVCLFRVCWVRGNFLAGRVIYFLCVWLRLCGAPGRYNFIQALSWSGWRDCSDFPFLWLFCSGYGTAEMARGVVCLSSRFLQFAVSSLGGWMFLVGFAFHKLIFFGRFVVFYRGFLFYRLLIILNLLQVVQAE